MDDIFTLIFFLWFAAAVIGSIFDKKRRRLPPTPNQDLDQRQQDLEQPTFEIPTLANDPNISRDPLPAEEVIEVKQVNNVEEIFRQRKNLVRQKLSLQSPSHDTTQAEVNNSEDKEKSPLNLKLTPEDTMNAMILSEIFNKPKALRRR